MKILRFLLVFALSVVGTNVSAQKASGAGPVIPDFLPIGTNFPAEGAVITVDIGYDDGNGTLFDSWSTTNYSSSNGTLEQVAQNLLEQAVEDYSPTAGTETADRTVYIQVRTVLGENRWQSLAAQIMSSLKLQNTASGWRLTNLPALAISYASYQAFLVPGLKAVKLDIKDTAGNNLFSEWSENGVSATNCSLFPGGASYQGPDVLELYNIIAVSASRPTNGVQGTITLYFDDAKTVWGAYNVDGVKVASSADPLVLSVSPVAPVGKSASPPAPAVRVTVTGLPAGEPVTLEYSENLKDWSVLTVITNSTGSVSTVDTATGSARFYRARIGGN